MKNSKNTGKEKVLRLLVVDDDENDRNNAETCLSDFVSGIWSENPYTDSIFYEASTPEQGIEILEKEQIDIIILDINFDVDDNSNIDGIEKFLVPVRQKGYNIPVLCWSFRTTYEWKAKIAGADEFRKKPPQNETKDICFALDYLLLHKYKLK